MGRLSRIAVDAALREVHTADAEIGVACGGYVEHLEIVQPLVEVLFVLGEREKLKRWAGALSHSTQWHTAQCVLGVVQRR